MATKKKSVKKSSKTEKVKNSVLISAKQALDITNEHKKKKDEKWFIEIKNLVILR